eukprot:TRINITY_DN10281_c0_g1_i1.p1 TRINITY_DN10281_c0_g1~~TRINITY_DN10281_c0_g1_i1.p1  ORF type:complete len:502 (-),score=118.43 TRINITY_DN10281_c0_g1_i1:9-1514(-)
MHQANKKLDKKLKESKLPKNMLKDFEKIKNTKMIDMVMPLDINQNNAKNEKKNSDQISHVRRELFMREDERILRCNLCERVLLRDVMLLHLEKEHDVHFVPKPKEIIEVDEPQVIEISPTIVHIPSAEIDSVRVPASALSSIGVKKEMAPPLSAFITKPKLNYDKLQSPVIDISSDIEEMDVDNPTDADADPPKPVEFPTLDLDKLEQSTTRKRSREGSDSEHPITKMQKIDENTAVVTSKTKPKKKRRKLSKKKLEIRKMMKKLKSRQSLYNHARENDDIFSIAGIKLEADRLKKDLPFEYPKRVDEHWTFSNTTFCEPGTAPKAISQPEPSPSAPNESIKKYMYTTSHHLQEIGTMKNDQGHPVRHMPIMMNSNLQTRYLYAQPSVVSQDHLKQPSYPRGDPSQSRPMLHQQYSHMGYNMNHGNVPGSMTGGNITGMTGGLTSGMTGIPNMTSSMPNPLAMSQYRNQYESYRNGLGQKTSQGYPQTSTSMNWKPQTLRR